MLASAVASLLLCGHVGSPNVFFDGAAGPYPVHIVIRPPAVIPGLAEIAVRLTAPAAAGHAAVTAQPVQWDAGPEGAPPPDAADPVRGAPGLYTTHLWLMTANAYRIRVAVTGAAGSGTVVVPVSTAATRRLPMKPGMSTLLVALGVLLFAGAMSLVGAGVRESVLPPGEPAGRRQHRRARFAMAATGLVLALLLVGGRSWWNRVDAAYLRHLYKPYQVRTAVHPDGPQLALDLTFDDERWRGRDWTPLLPDHGKLMHLFLLRNPGFDAFAHLHPAPAPSPSNASVMDTFRVALPRLPAGSYRVFADITEESGRAETVTATVNLPAPPAPPAPFDTQGAVIAADPDDSVRLGPPLTWRPPAPSLVSPLDGGLTMTWLRPLSRRPAAGSDAALHFAVRTPDGRPVPLEPYMGMLAHAVVCRDDGKVFMHLHPHGTTSMAALHDPGATAGLSGMPGMSGMSGMPGMSGPPGMLATMAMPATAAAAGPAAAPVGEVSFPYEMPEPGRYRIWVQVKTGAQIRTGVFDVDVAPAG